VTGSVAVLPDYGAANLFGVVPGLMAPPAQRPDWLPAEARAPEQVVLLVLDGLGWHQLQDRLALAPNLAGLQGGPITSVAPTTTATALTSLVTGSPPSVHGIVGYRVVVEGPLGPEVMNVLKWKTAGGDARLLVDPSTFQAAVPFGGRPVPVVSKAVFAGTGFTDAHQRGARQIGWHESSALAVDVKKVVDTGEPFVYAYYDGIDRTAHIYGFDDHYDAELGAADRIVGELLNRLPSEVVLVVTADHGQVEVRERVIDLPPAVMSHVSLVSGEPRFRWLHTVSGADGEVDELAGICKDLYGHQAWVSTYEEVEAAGWMGGPLPPEFRARLGDVAILPFEPVAYLEPGEGREHLLACRHGSLTADEMFVPLIAGKGRL
jgi:hypothetical protein